MPYGTDVSLGDSFRAWTEETFETVMSGIITNLPHNHLATIVSFLISTLLGFRSTIISINARSSIRCSQQTTNGYKTFTCGRLVHSNVGLFSFFLDASHSGATPFVPAVENMTLALTHPAMTKPHFRYLYISYSHFDFLEARRPILATKAARTTSSCTQ